MKNNTSEPAFPFLDDRSWPLEVEFNKKGFKAICVADPSANRLLSEFREGETYWAYPLGGKKGYLIWPDATTNTICAPDDFNTYFRKVKDC